MCWEGNFTQLNGGMNTEYKKLILTFWFPKLQLTELMHIAQYYKEVTNTLPCALIMLSTLDEKKVPKRPVGFKFDTDRTFLILQS